MYVYVRSSADIWQWVPVSGILRSVSWATAGRYWPVDCIEVVGRGVYDQTSVRVCATKTMVTSAGRAIDQDSIDQWVVQDLIPSLFTTDGAVAATQAIEM